jgi:hypothetical protein
MQIPQSTIIQNTISKAVSSIFFIIPPYAEIFKHITPYTYMMDFTYLARAFTEGAGATFPAIYTVSIGTLVTAELIAVFL